MNPEQFILMMNDLPDAVIDSANSPVVMQKKKIWYMIPAVAACFIALISAALYPKLRIQTPEITALSVPTAESTVTTTVPDTTDRPETQTVTASVHSTVSSATVTFKTTAKTSEYSAAVTETLSQTDDPAVTAEIPGIEPTTTENIIPETQTVTETTVLTEQHIETTDKIDTQERIEGPTIEIPLWKGGSAGPESMGIPHLYSQFFLSTGDMDAWMRTLYGIPQDFDLTKNQCLLIEIDTAYKNAVIAGCQPTSNGLTFVAAYLAEDTIVNKQIHYAMPIPENMTITPEQCNVSYLELTDESMLHEMETDKLEFPVVNEQEGSL